MIKIHMLLTLIVLLSMTLVSCQVTKEDPAIHFQLTLNLDDVSNLQDAIIDKLANLALSKGDTELASGLAIVSHELRRYLTDTGTPTDSHVTIMLDSDRQGGRLFIHYLDEKQQQQGGKHRLSSDQTQKIYNFLSGWLASKK